ncbi:MAG: peptidylprolyl isomerase [Bacteroidia bacterium]|nr:peptidylprolyl isomerase [Bacteroidia bacterium]
MALIGDIRKSSWILIVFIGLGLGGFIFMDSFSGQQSLFGSSQLSAGEINGTNVDWNNFNRMESTLYGNSGTDVFTRRNIIWNYFVENAIVTEEADDIGGLGVTVAELNDLQFGNNVSPIIRARFANPSTGQVDFAQLNQIRQQIQGGTLQPELVRYWAYQEKEIIKDRTQAKLNAMVTKGMYAPTWQVEMLHQEQNQQVDFNYVRIPFGDIDDSDITLTDADFKNYIDENRATLEQDEETRKVEYVVFDILPTALDSAAIIGRLVELKGQFEEAENDTVFVTNNLGSLDGAYVTKENVNEDVADALFGQTAGTTYGPYLEGDSYKVAKLIESKVLPDSVRSRHILLPVTTQAELTVAQARIDSMITELEAGRAVFDTLAARFGTDNTRTTGGDLGYAFPGMMVKPFNDLIFFYAEEGEYNTVITQFGIHLVEVTGRKYINREEGARIGYISEVISPSEDTEDSEYQRVTEFVSKNRTLVDLRAGAAELGLTTEVSAALKANDYSFGTLGIGQISRDVIRYAFSGNTYVNDVSAEIYTYQDPVHRFNNKHVVVGLANIQEEGVPSVESVRTEIENRVLNLKKGEAAKALISGSDLASIASQFDAVVDSLQNVSFSTSFASGLGNEPKVLAAAYQLEPNLVSEPIVGENGVYVVQLIRKGDPPVAANIPQLRKSTASSIQIQTATNLMQSLKKQADIEDSRARFY